MADAQQAFVNMASLAATVLVPSTAVLVGLVPRAGPGRALALAARSWVRRAKKVSQRDDATSTLRGMLRNLPDD